MLIFLASLVAEPHSKPACSCTETDDRRLSAVKKLESIFLSAVIDFGSPTGATEALVPLTVVVDDTATWHIDLSSNMDVFKDTSSVVRKRPLRFPVKC